MSQFALQLLVNWGYMKVPRIIPLDVALFIHFLESQTFIDNKILEINQDICGVHPNGPSTCNMSVRALMDFFFLALEVESKEIQQYFKLHGGL